jgi:hypothetical protein
MSNVGLFDIDRERLGKLLGLLGSDHDGEIAAAGRAAHQMIRAAWLTWGEVLAPAPRAPIHPAPLIVECLRLPDLLSDWERNFLTSIARYSSRLSDKQAECLHRICRRLGIGCRV